MGKNVGTVDRALRVIAGLALIAVFLFGGLASPWNWIALVVAVVLVGTSLIGFCPAYRLVGIRSCPADPA